MQRMQKLSSRVFSTSWNNVFSHNSSLIFGRPESRKFRMDIQPLETSHSQLHKSYFGTAKGQLLSSESFDILIRRCLDLAEVPFWDG
jgi:hypothetical protein